jgi:hypothetical protein
MVQTMQMSPTYQSQCHGMLQCRGMFWTAWLWPYAPQGLPAFTGQMDAEIPSTRTMGSDHITRACDAKERSIW